MWGSCVALGCGLFLRRVFCACSLFAERQTVFLTLQCSSLALFSSGHWSPVISNASLCSSTEPHGRGSPQRACALRLRSGTTSGEIAASLQAPGRAVRCRRGAASFSLFFVALLLLPPVLWRRLGRSGACRDLVSCAATERTKNERAGGDWFIVQRSLYFVAYVAAIHRSLCSLSASLACQWRAEGCHFLVLPKALSLSSVGLRACSTSPCEPSHCRGWRV